MGDLAQRPSVDLAREWLRDLAQAWLVLDSMVGSKSGAKSPTRVKQIDPPLPLNVHALDSKMPIEAFASTYSALLLQRALRERDPKVRARMWVPVRGDGPVQLLAAIAMNVDFFLHHPTAVVAWGFSGELEDLHVDTAWARRGVDRVKRVSIGVPCRECDGVYQVEVPAGPAGGGAGRKRAFGASGPRAVCSLNDAHKMAAREVGA